VIALLSLYFLTSSRDLKSKHSKGFQLNVHDQFQNSHNYSNDINVIFTPTNTHTSLQHLNEGHKNSSEKAADCVNPTEVSLVSRQAAFPLRSFFHSARFDYCVGSPNTVSSTDPDLLCT
jgi:hypothetical protein